MKKILKFIIPIISILMLTVQSSLPLVNAINNNDEQLVEFNLERERNEFL